MDAGPAMSGADAMNALHVHCATLLPQTAALQPQTAVLDAQMPPPSGGMLLYVSAITVSANTSPATSSVCVGTSWRTPRYRLATSTLSTSSRPSMPSALRPVPVL